MLTVTYSNTIKKNNPGKKFQHKPKPIVYIQLFTRIGHSFAPDIARFGDVLFALCFNFRDEGMSSCLAIEANAPVLF